MLLLLRFVDQSIQMIWPIQIVLVLDHVLVLLVVQTFDLIVVAVVVVVVADLL